MASFVERRICDSHEAFDLSLGGTLEIVVALWACAHLLNLLAFSALILVRVVKQHIISLFTDSKRLIGTLVVVLSRCVSSKPSELFLLALIVKLGLVNELAVVKAFAWVRLNEFVDH